MIGFLLLFAAAATTPSRVLPPALTKAVGACSAVTAADVQRALGRNFAPGREETHGADSTCDYASGNGQVSITLQRLSAKLDLPAEIASLKNSIQDSSVRLAQASGDTAFYLDIAGAGTQLHVIRNDREYIMISILGFGEAAQVSAAAERLARAALGRI